MMRIKPYWRRLQTFLFGGERRKRRILVMAPNAWFPSMLAGPAIVARALQDQGHHVEVLSCDAARQTCTVMDGMAPQEERPVRRFCEPCTRQSQHYLARYGLNQILDTALLREKDHAELRALSSQIGDDPRTFAWDGIPIGVLAGGNLSAILKRDVIAEPTDHTQARLRIMVEDGLRWYVSARAILATRRPDILVYYAEYYPEVIVGMVLQREGVRVVPVVHSGLNGNDFRKLQIIDQMPQVLEMPRRLATWSVWRDLPLAPPQVREIGDDVVTRLLGNSVISFSPGLNEDELAKVTARLRRDLKTIVVFTSSDDELNNTKKQRDIFGMPLVTTGEVFSDQVEWLKAIADFVAGSESHQMVVRFHPRLGANARSGSVAEYRNQVDAVTRDDCERIHVVLPESKCSSYDLAQHADLVLTSWSTIGLECVRIGLPVMMAFRGSGVYPPDDFLNFCTTREAYFSLLSNGIPVDVTDLLRAFRFTHMFLCATAIDLSGLVPSFDDPVLPDYRSLDQVVVDDIKACVIGDERMHERRLAAQRRNEGLEANDRERSEVARAIRRLVHTLAFRRDATPSDVFPLHSLGNDESLPSDALCIATGKEDDQVDLAFDGQRTTCRSKAIRNLLRFHAELMPNRRRSAA